jgi:hypothetical protein
LSTQQRLFERFPDRQENAEDVDVEMAVELFFRERFDRAERAHAGIVYQDVDRTKLACRFGEHALDIGGFRDVALDRSRLASGSGAVVDNFVCDAQLVP